MAEHLKESSRAQASSASHIANPELATPQVEDVALGVDIGGTSIKVGCLSISGNLLGETTVPTPALVNEEAYNIVFASLTDLLAHCAGEGKLRAIGLAVPAPVLEDGSVPMVANASLNAPELREYLAKSFPGVRVSLVNDANAATLGELWRGSAAQYQSLVFLTLGTGVGGGIVVNRKLVRGRAGAAGEVGHIRVNPAETRVCGCGNKGCLEQYGSARGLAYLYQEACKEAGVEGRSLAHESDVLPIFAAYRDGEKEAKVAVSAMVDWLAAGLSMLAHTVDPEVFVLGGGVVGAFDLFEEELRERYKYYTLPMCEDTPILPALLGNRAGMYGAAFEALSEAGLV